MPVWFKAAASNAQNQNLYYLDHTVQLLDHSSKLKRKVPETGALRKGWKVIFQDSYVSMLLEDKGK